MSPKVLKMFIVLMGAAVFLRGSSALQGLPEMDPTDEPREGEHEEEEETNESNFCLHGDNVIQTTYGTKLVRDLNTGDKVATVDSSGTAKYESVTLDLHKNEKATASFYEIRTENRELKLTPQHLIYIGKSIAEARLVASAEVSVGDEVIVDGAGNVRVEKVTAVSRFTDVGIYNPVVASGRMFVGGILASNYVHLAPFTATHQHYVVWLLRQIDNIIPGVMAHNDNLLETHVNYILENLLLKAYSKLF